ncbi:MAG: FAD-dependent oxidoreductase [Chitinophagales bacterium]
MYDFLIVGQGIAGTLLAEELLNHQQSVKIIDRYHSNSSSNIATGIVNPVTGRKLVKTWMIDDLLPVCDVVYQSIERKLDTKFMYHQPIYKLFSNEDDIAIWNKRKNDIEYTSYLGNIISIQNKFVNNHLGAGIIEKCFWLDVPLFIATFRKHFIKNDLLSDEVFDYNELKITDTIQYQNIKAKHIIFCEGYKAIENPLFNFIPFTTAKGEYLVFQSDELQLDTILNKNFILLPKGNNMYSVGSTFVWNDLEETMTESSRQELTEKLTKIITCDFTILEEKAGIRPTMKDRRPVLGSHPQYKNVHILNGFGTKGVSLGTYFAKHLVQNLLFDTKIMQEVSINRF